jgi:hypothetical protein
MSRHYFEDKVAGERHEYGTEEEALAGAEETLRYYRRDARQDGEWSADVVDVVVGRVNPDAVDEDETHVPTHRATAVGDKAGGFDYAMRPVPEPEPAPTP